MASDADARKMQQQAAAEHAVGEVQSGMRLGYGTGSTASFALRKLAAELRNGRLRDLSGVPSSEATAELARELGLPLTTLDEHPKLDLTIDGADEVDPALNLIKGGGGALLREKMLAQASVRLIVVVDESKLSTALGERFAVPVEVLSFGWRAQQRFLEGLGAEVSLRRTRDNRPFHTDNGNLILDCRFTPPFDLEQLATQLGSRAGVLEHGLFLGLATDLVCAGSGGITHKTVP
ncbi:MAG TPA: ribose 5-phosphate isomerase A [Polyangiales bacterium]|nr:ribose 5-phosphate isomerase A [Polyangiales bacterium]